MSEPNWKTTDTAPEREVVLTKIDDERGVRNIQSLKRIGNLWFFPDGGMYVYYRPTHWATEPRKADDQAGTGGRVMTLAEQLENNFDPSDVDGAMQLAYKSLTLAKLAQEAIETDNVGLRMGRDQKGFLNSAILEVAIQLGLLDSWACAEEIQRFRTSR